MLFEVNIQMTFDDFCILLHKYHNTDLGSIPLLSALTDVTIHEYQRGMNRPTVDSSSALTSQTNHASGCE